MEIDLHPIIVTRDLTLLQTLYGNESQCELFLHQSKWKTGITSPFDNYSKVYLCTGNRFRCKNTKKYFNVKTNTLFHNSKVPLQIWFKAIWIVANSGKLTSVALANELKLTQKTAWYMLRRIKKYLQQTGVQVENKLYLIPAIETEKSEKLGLSQWLDLLKNSKEKGFS